MTKSDRHSEAGEDPPVARTSKEIAAREAENALLQFDRLRELIRSAVSSGTLRLRTSTLMKLNRLAIAGLHERAGAYRTVPIEIHGSKHDPPEWEDVPELVDDLCDYVNSHGDKPAIHLAAYVMWRLNWIHPFYDGNGRTTRAVSYLVLCSRLGYELPGTNTIPEIIAANKKPYYDALDAADAHAKVGKLDVGVMEQLLDQALAEQLASVLSDAKQDNRGAASGSRPSGIRATGSTPSDQTTRQTRSSKWTSQPKWRRILIAAGGAVLFVGPVVWQVVINWDNATFARLRQWTLESLNVTSKRAGEVPSPAPFAKLVLIRNEYGAFRPYFAGCRRGGRAACEGAGHGRRYHLRGLGCASGVDERGDHFSRPVKVVEDGFATTPDGIRRWVRRLKRRCPGRIVCCYEAGPLGYGLQRTLIGLGVDCIVIAPSLIPSKPGDRIKTDRRDALKLAELLAAGLLTEVHVPTPEQEAIRDLCRARGSVKGDQKRIQHRLSKFLLRRAIRWTSGRKMWTRAHQSGLRGRRLEHAADQDILDDHLLALEQNEGRLAALDEKLAHWSTQEPYAQAVAWLRCFRGIDTLTALSIVAEIHDWRRFPSPRALMAYLGMVPSESSSGGQVPTRRPHQGRQQSRSTAADRVGLALPTSSERWVPARQAKGRPGPAEIIAIADRAQQRLHRRYARLSARGKSQNLVIAAVGRELVGFLWAAMQRTEIRSA